MVADPLAAHLAQVPGGVIRAVRWQHCLADWLHPLVGKRRMVRLGDEELLSRLREKHLRGRHPLLSIHYVAEFAERIAPGRATGQTLRDARDMLAGRIVGCASTTRRHEAIVLAAAALAVSGQPTHVIALSAKKAAEISMTARPLFEVLHLTSATLGDELDLNSNGTEYLADVVFASAGRLAQDRFRLEVGYGGTLAGMRASVQRLAKSANDAGARMPAWRVAVVDDADLVMIEAVSPVKIAENAEREIGRVYADQAFQIITSLVRDQHYSVDGASGRIILLDDGEARLETFALYFGGAWNDAEWRERTVLAALTVRDVFHPDTHYSTDAGAVALTNRPPPSPERPTIEELVAAKEDLGSGVRAVHLSDTQRLFQSYDSLCGTASSVRNLSHDFKELYGLSIKAERHLDPPEPPQLFSTRGALTMKLEADVRLLPDDVIWAPFEADTKSLPWNTDDMTVLTGYHIFDLELPPKRIIQVGAGHVNWERRLRSDYPDAKILGYASPEDGLFSALDKSEAALEGFARCPDAANYRAACAAALASASEARTRHHKSNLFFDRILSFVRS